MSATCNTCGSALEGAQRYCVGCGSRNSNAADPAAAHLATATRDSRLVSTARKSGTKRGFSPLVGLLVLAIPLALAAGILIGKGNGDDELLQALKNRPAPVVNVSGTGSVDAGAVTKAKPAAGKVLATSAGGAIHDLATYVPSPAKKASDIKQIKSCMRLKGTAYLQCQKNFSDIVGTGPGGGGNDGAPTGQGD